MVKLGIELLKNYKHLFEGKRVGLITNPTGVDSSLKSTIDILNEQTYLTTLFSPEHGIRGDLQAGVKLDDYIDPKTNIKVYSLYGKNKKPTKEMLEGIDIICFDIQDVGSRYYTYIYSMAYIMIAAYENDIEVVVFDRPNPVGANEVEGTILDLNYRSFVGYYPIVQRYGMTIGELANLFNKEYDINAKLHVIKMEGYKRNMIYEDTNLPFIMPSPNIPTKVTPFAYLATCIFEGTNLSEGRGTTKPFEIIGSPWLDTEKLLNDILTKDLKGVIFREVFFTPTFSKHEGILCKGIEMIITDFKIFKPVETGFTMMYLIKDNNSEFEFIKPFKEGLNPMIDLLTGSNSLREGTQNLEDCLLKIKKDSLTFKKTKERYHIYE